MTMVYKIFHGPSAVHFYEGDPSSVESGQPNQETFADESAAISRLLELDANFIPDWSRGEFYDVGDRVKFGSSVYRSLQQNSAGQFAPPPDGLDLAALTPTPANTPERWALAYDPNLEDLP